MQPQSCQSFDRNELGNLERRLHPALYQSTTTNNKQVDFAHYKNIVKNQKIVSELEQSFKSFKPVDYDVGAQLKAIDAFQEKAVGFPFQRTAISMLDH